MSLIPYFEPMKPSSRAKDAKFSPVRLSETGKETLVFPAKNHNQTVIFQRGDPITNLSCSFCSRPRKSKIHLERKLFSRILHFFLQERRIFGVLGAELLFGLILRRWMRWLAGVERILLDFSSNRFF